MEKVAQELVRFKFASHLDEEEATLDKNGSKEKECRALKRNLLLKMRKGTLPVKLLSHPFFDPLKQPRETFKTPEYGPRTIPFPVMDEEDPELAEVEAAISRLGLEEPPSIVRKSKPILASPDNGIPNWASSDENIPPQPSAQSPLPPGVPTTQEAARSKVDWNTIHCSPLPGAAPKPYSLRSSSAWKSRK